jgi:hypothetical protein
VSGVTVAAGSVTMALGAAARARLNDRHRSMKTNTRTGAGDPFMPPTRVIDLLPLVTQFGAIGGVCRVNIGGCTAIIVKLGL